MVYNSVVLASRPAEFMTANKNCKLGLQKRSTRKRLFATINQLATLSLRTCGMTVNIFKICFPKGADEFFR